MQMRKSTQVLNDTEVFQRKGILKSSRYTLWHRLHKMHKIQNMFHLES